MFEVGRDYKFHIVEDSPGGSGVVEQVWTVDAVDGTLLRLSNKYEKAPVILNAASSRFVKAVLIEKSSQNSKPGLLSRETERWVDTPPSDRTGPQVL
jgi:hypothetical protein